MKTTVTAAVLVWLLVCSGGAAEAPQAVGVVVFKDRPTQADTDAKVIVFTRMERFPNSVMTRFETGRYDALSLENTRIAWVVYETGLLEQLLDTEDRQKLAKKHDELIAFLKKYPQTAKVLQPVIDSFKQHMDAMDRGHVRLGGAWMTATAYQARLKEEQAAVEAQKQREVAMVEQEKKRREAMRRDAQQRDRNLAARGSTRAGAFLIDNFASFPGSIDSKGTPPEKFHLPSVVTENSQALPRPPTPEGEFDVALSEGRELNAPAVLFVRENGVLNSFRLAVTCRTDKQGVPNSVDMQTSLEILKVALPSLAQALPLWVASARTRLELQKGKPGAKNEVSLFRKFGEHPCEVFVTEPIVESDGATRSILSITVR